MAKSRRATLTLEFRYWQKLKIENTSCHFCQHTKKKAANPKRKPSLTSSFGYNPFSRSWKHLWTHDEASSSWLFGTFCLQRRRRTLGCSHQNNWTWQMGAAEEVWSRRQSFVVVVAQRSIFQTFEAPSLSVNKKVGFHKSITLSVRLGSTVINAAAPVSKQIWQNLIAKRRRIKSFQQHSRSSSR